MTGLYYIKNKDSVTHTGDFNHALLQLARIQTSSYTFNPTYINFTNNTVHPASVKNTHTKNNLPTLLFLSMSPEPDIFFYLALI